MKDHRQFSPRIWPNVRKFLESQTPGSTVIDVGCGEAKYTRSSVFVLGVDTCADALIGRALKSPPNHLDLLLADALKLPFRDNTADAILNVSVLHHLSTASRRKAALEECGRCLRPGGQMLTYVWAYEQPNGSFKSQDLLVPWNLSEIPINGRLPQVKFHKDSTKEQRVIQASIPIAVNEDEPSKCSVNWFGSLFNKSIRPLFTFTKTSAPSPPPAAPKFLPNAKQSLITGVKRWSPMLGRRLATLLISVEEQLADEVTQKILHEAITETMAALKEVTFYRFYHVFRQGELESLITSVPSMKVVQSSFEHGNWSSDDNVKADSDGLS
nr:Methyltransferase type 11 domain containing protein [Haemonchus contortus]